MQDILYQVLFIVIIIATLMLILVLWRLYMVLTDINDTTKITKRRARDFDLWLSEAEKAFNNFSDMLKSFVGTFNQFKQIKNKISALFENDDQSNEKDKQEG